MSEKYAVNITEPAKTDINEVNVLAVIDGRRNVQEVLLKKLAQKDAEPPEN